MQINEITVDVVKNYLRIDDDNDDDLLNSLLLSALNYISTYTGRTIENLNKYEALFPIVLIYIANLYDNRTVEVNERINNSKNMLINSTLDLYCNNNIAL